ncbi:MAG TPA: helix-turn-helix domain-containing protein [Planctomycetaceae bacterium]|nr:helix-turn-helix domain-containing protein [Planctomycetaceae bacterium]
MSERTKEIAEYASEHGVSAAAKKFDTTNQNVYSYLFQNGLRGAVSDRKGTAAVNSFACLKMVLDGTKQSEVARTLGITRQRVNQIIKLARLGGFDV